MATTRKRPTSSSSGFSSKEPETSAETASVEEFLEENAREMFETISQAEEEQEEHVEREEEKPAPAVEPPKAVTPPSPPPAVKFVPQEIVPTEDAGPRFVEPIPPTPTKPKVDTPVLKAPPKRHPRNVPRFTPHK